MSTRKFGRTALVAVLALSIVLSITGGTIAWFTDEVTSANNVIQSGNLDIELEYWNGSAYAKVNENTKLFKENTLWEPGYTEVAYLKVTNAGSLALQYQLNVNVADEILGKTKEGADIRLSDHLAFKVLESDTDLANTLNRESARNADAAENALKPYAGEFRSMEPGSAADYIALIVYMPETVGNEANHNGKDVPSVELGVNLYATQFTFEEDGFGNNQYDAAAALQVTTAAEAQAALDHAVSGTTIMLAPGVDYGTLYLRPVAGQANTVTDCDYLVYRNEMLRKVENLTIVGAPGATVDAIVTVAGYVKDSGSTGYVVDIQNLVIDSVEFTDAHTNAPHSYASPVFIDLSYINVNGLTVKNCKLIGNNNKMNFVYFYGSGNPSNSTFETAAKNITITGNTVDGIARLCELRQTENVTITNNTIKNTALHGMLLPVDGGTYSGNVTITGNTADGINERFVRMAGTGAANVVIKNNTITNYLGEDDDYIKVTDTTAAPVIENNTITYAHKVSGADEVKTILAKATDGDTIYLKAGTYDELSFTNPSGFKAKNLTIIGEENAVVEGLAINGWSADSNIVIDGLTIKNVTFTSGLLLSTKSMTNVTVEDCVFLNDACIHQNDKTEKLTNLVVKNCTFTGDMSGNTTAIMLENTENVTVTGCTFNHIDFNVLQAGILSGDILFDRNTVNGTGDRVFRFVNVANADITISNNTIVSKGDGDGELAKASNPISIKLVNNTWNGMSDAAVAAKLINITAK